MNKVEFCPLCGNEMIKDSTTGKYHCKNCNKNFVKRALCDKCGRETEKLAACGAEQFFCNHCNDLKSKKKLEFFFKEDVGKEEIS